MSTRCLVIHTRVVSFSLITSTLTLQSSHPPNFPLQWLHILPWLPPRPRQMAGSLRGDDRVRLHSLQGAAQQHNGAAGHLRSWNAGTGRWDVKLSTGPELSVRPTNLTTLCSRPGCAIGETEARLKSCARCKVAAYCSKACQVAAWKGGHKQECKALQEERQQRVSAAFAPHGTATVLMKLSDEGNHRGVVKMAEEGLAVAGEVRRARPDVAARIYRMLGHSFVQRFEHVKGLGLLEQARALAVESGDRAVLGDVCNSLGGFHLDQGEHEKAIEEYEQMRAIAVELGSRQGERNACHNLGMSYTSLKQYDKAIELFE